LQRQVLHRFLQHSQSWAQARGHQSQVDVMRKRRALRRWSVSNAGSG
jgi:hypothetical protein